VDGLVTNCFVHCFDHILTSNPYCSCAN